MARTYRLEIYLHWKDESGIQRVEAAIRALLPTHKTGLRRHGNARVVTSYYKGWPVLSQHGPGFKHSRPIVLVPWQRSIFERYPFEFLRGCLDSDGCRHRRLVNGRNYPAYSFKNHSEDILRLFCEACDLLEIHWPRANWVTISIARRADVARLDALFAERFASR